MLENHALALLCGIGKRFPARIPAINRLITRTLSRIREDRCQPPGLLHAAPGAVHRDGVRGAARGTGPEALRRVLDMIERRGYAVPFPIEYRIVAGDDAYLSTAHERETVYIAVHMYRGMAWEPYFRAVEAIMDDYEGRPHWGKRHFQSAATLAPRYPGVGPLPGRARAPRPRGPLPERVRPARARPRRTPVTASA